MIKLRRAIATPRELYPKNGGRSRAQCGDSNP
jgi:hypothetical protein